MPWIWLILIDLASVGSFTWLVMNHHPYAAIVPAAMALGNGFKSKKEGK